MEVFYREFIQNLKKNVKKKNTVNMSLAPLSKIWFIVAAFTKLTFIRQMF